MKPTRQSNSLERDYQRAIELIRAGRQRAALAHLADLVKRAPTQWRYLLTYGDTLLVCKQFAQARAQYEAVLQIDSSLAAAHAGLGNAALLEGESLPAEQHLKRALQLQSNQGWALNRVTALERSGQPGEALREAQRAVAMEPSPAAFAALERLAVAQGRTGLLEQALRDALELAPETSTLYGRLASLLFRENRFADAAALYLEAARRFPDNAEFQNSAGAALASMGRKEDALSLLGRALELDPSLAGAWLNRGTLLVEAARESEAIPVLEHYLELCPHDLMARTRLAFARMQVADWRAVPRLRAELIEPALAACDGGAPPSPFSFLSLPGGISSAELARMGAGFARHSTRGCAPLFGEYRPSDSRLRIGYLSTDFGNHPVSHLLASHFALHDRSAFEVYGFAIGADDGSDFRRQVRDGCDVFRDLTALSDRDAAAAIHAAGIDVLVDLNGYTRGSRPGILAARPAPVQFSYLGYPGLQNNGYIDYVIGDGVVTPEAEQGLCSERFVQMPYSYYPANGAELAFSLDTDRSAHGLPVDGVVFCCFNNQYKVDPESFAAWMEILAGVPGSVLWLVAGNALARENLCREARDRGIAPQRLVFAERVPREQYLRRMGLADLFLDTVIYNAHTTAVDAFMAGVPVLTLPGATFAGRVGKSLALALGMPEMVAVDRSQYCRLAITLGRDEAQRRAVRARLRQARESSPLFDTHYQVRCFEQAFRHAWGRWRQGLPPQAFKVELPFHGRTEAAPSVARDPVLEEEYRRALALVRDGDLKAALARLETVVKQAPEQPRYALTYADCLVVSKRLDEARGQYLRVLNADPSLAAAHAGLGNVALIQGDPQQAEQHLARALRLKAEMGWTLNRVSALERAGRSREALEALQRALENEPAHSQALQVLERLACGQGAYALVEAALRRAMESAPQRPDLYGKLALILFREQRFADSAAVYIDAAQRFPDNAEFHNSAGAALASLGRKQEALPHLQRALELDPSLLSAWLNRGSLLLELRREPEAIPVLEHYLQRCPDDLLARTRLEFARMQVADWHAVAQLRTSLIEPTLGLTQQQEPPSPFTFLSLPGGIDTGELAQLGAVFSRWYTRGFAPAFDSYRDPGPRLRIAYLSTDFANHPVSHLLGSHFGRHDRAGFEVYGYAISEDDGSEYRRQVRTGCDVFRDLSALSDRDIAARIHADGIDVLVDLNGYTRGCRPGILACRPAPVQFTYLGYPGPLNNVYTDYVISDAVVTPGEEQGLYAERFVYMPHSYYPANAVEMGFAVETDRRSHGLPDGAVVFCCFNTQYKVDPQSFAAWMAIVANVPDSVLWLPAPSELAQTNLRAAAAASGVDPQRLVFAPLVPRATFLRRMGLADLFLDTFVYNAHTTAVDAFMAGIPVLTLPGNTFAARVGKSLALALGMPEMVARDRDDFCRLGIALGRDGERRGALKARLQQALQQSTLFDTDYQVRCFEQAYRHAWERWQQGLPPQGFSVDLPH